LLNHRDQALPSLAAYFLIIMYVELCWLSLIQMTFLGWTTDKKEWLNRLQEGVEWGEQGCAHVCLTHTNPCHAITLFILRQQISQRC
jgi:hypothetical protein